MLSESTPTAHFYLVLGALILLSLFIVFVYVIGYRSKIDEYDDWIETFRQVGISDTDIQLITHDDSGWYYKNTSMCIGYGDAEEECPIYESYCAGGTKDGVHYTYGTLRQQALALKQAIVNGGRHGECPLIYDDT